MPPPSHPRESVCIIGLSPAAEVPALRLYKLDPLWKQHGYPPHISSKTTSVTLMPGVLPSFLLALFLYYLLMAGIGLGTGEITVNRKDTGASPHGAYRPIQERSSKSRHTGKKAITMMSVPRKQSSEIGTNWGRNGHLLRLASQGTSP